MDSKEVIEMKLSLLEKDWSIFDDQDMDHDIGDGMGYQIVDISRCISPWFGLRVLQEFCSMYDLHSTGEMYSIEVSGGLRYVHETYLNLDKYPATRNCGIVGLVRVSEPFDMFGRPASAFCSRPNKQSNYKKYLVWECADDFLVIGAFGGHPSLFKKIAERLTSDILEERSYDYVPFTITNYHLADSGGRDPTTGKFTKSKKFRANYSSNRRQYPADDEGENKWVMRGQAFSVVVEDDKQFEFPYVIPLNKEHSTSEENTKNTCTDILISKSHQFRSYKSELQCITNILDLGQFKVHHSILYLKIELIGSPTHSYVLYIKLFVLITLVSNELPNMIEGSDLIFRHLSVALNIPIVLYHSDLCIMTSREDYDPYELSPLGFEVIIAIIEQLNYELNPYEDDEPMTRSLVEITSSISSDYGSTFDFFSDIELDLEQNLNVIDFDNEQDHFMIALYNVIEEDADVNENENDQNDRTSSHDYEILTELIIKNFPLFNKEKNWIMATNCVTRRLSSFRIKAMHIYTSKQHEGD
jgi:hypothetical protein